MIPHRDKPMDVPLGNRVYECQYGKDRNGSHKERYHRQKAEEEEVSLDYILSGTQNVHLYLTEFGPIFSPKNTSTQFYSTHFYQVQQNVNERPHFIQSRSTSTFFCT